MLLDIFLPDRSGWRVLQSLKHDPKTQDIPVVVLSVNEDRAHALALGAAEHIVKPADRDMLAATVMRLRAQASGARRAAARITAAHAESTPASAAACAASTRATTSVTRLPVGMCRNSFGPCAFEFGPSTPVTTNCASGNFSPSMRHEWDRAALAHHRHRLAPRRV